MSIPRAPDAAVDAVQIRWKPGPDQFLTRGALPEEHAAYPVLRNLVSLLSWDEAWLLAEGVAGRRTLGMDMRSVAYPTSYTADDSQEADRPAADEVVLADGAGNQARVGAAALDRLIGRLLKAMIAGAESESLPETRADWWPGFVELADQIAGRA